MINQINVFHYSSFRVTTIALVRLCLGLFPLYPLYYLSELCFVCCYFSVRLFLSCNPYCFCARVITVRDTHLVQGSILLTSVVLSSDLYFDLFELYFYTRCELL